MDAGLSRAGIVRKRDPHDWNSYDHYQTIHEKRLAVHPFIDESRPNTVESEHIIGETINVDGGGHIMPGG